MRFSILFVMACATFGATWEEEMKAGREAAAANQPGKAEKHFEAALAIPSARWKFITYSELARLYESQKDLEKAESAAAQAVQAAGSGGGAVVPYLDQLAEIRARRRNFAGAADAYAQVVSYWERTAGKSEPVTARALANLARARSYQGNAEEALDLHKRSLEIMRVAYGDQSASYAYALAKLAGAYENQKNWPAAISAYETVLKILETKMDRTSWLYAGIADAYGRALSQAGRKEEAAKHRFAEKPVAQPRPEIQLRHEPGYTEEARRKRIQGTITLALKVDENGVPRDVIVTEPLGAGLDDNALAAVQTWRFRPAMKDGSPVPSYALVNVFFRLL
jgi:TonB family protein